MAYNWQWLDELSYESILHGELPMRKILKDSVYYPSAGLEDGSPVENLSKLSRSFVYVDQNVSREELKQTFRGHGFRGYQVLAHREIDLYEIWCNQNFVPPYHFTYWGFEMILNHFAKHHPQGSAEGFEHKDHKRHKIKLHEKPGEIDGDPSYIRKTLGWDVYKQAHADWLVLERHPEYDEEHGPKRFSFFFFCGDGPLSYDLLYYHYKVCPLAFCIIRPGTGFGMNWTDYRKPGRIMHRLVMNNPAGIPKYLLQEPGWREDEKKAYWHEYGKLLKEFEDTKTYLFEHG